MNSMHTDTFDCKLLCPSQKCLYPTATTTTVLPKILLIATRPKIWQKPTTTQENRPIGIHDSYKVKNVFGIIFLLYLFHKYLQKHFNLKMKV